VTLPVSFAEFDEDMFPFRVVWFRGDEQVHEATVSGPGALVIPALGDITHTRIEFADGTIIEGAPPA
jgi:hypothetical protein